jgi:hypothetical protein
MRPVLVDVVVDVVVDVLVEDVGDVGDVVTGSVSACC